MISNYIKQVGQLLARDMQQKEDRQDMVHRIEILEKELQATRSSREGYKAEHNEMQEKVRQADR